MRRRRAAAAVELVLLLPFLALLFLLSVDFGRLYYCYIIVTNCARNGALYASDPAAAAESNYPDLTSAALADAPDLSPQPTVNSAGGSDANGDPYVEVTVAYPFQTVGLYPGLPGTINVTRTVRMRVAPATPN